MLDDLRYALRTLTRDPGFTAVAVITVSVGIAANAAIFSIVNAVLLRGLPYAEPDRLVAVWETSEITGAQNGLASYPNLQDWREAGAFQSLAAFNDWGPTLTGEGPAERLTAGAASAEFFSTLGVAPAMGRDFLAEDDDEAAEPVVILTDGLWRRRFNGDATVVGRSLRLNGTAHRVVGVLPRGFEFPPLARAELWRPLRVDGERREERGNHFLDVVGRLRPDASLESTAGAMRAVAGRLASRYPDSNAGHGVRLVPLHDQIVSDVQLALFVLLACVGAVLAIVCANVGGLMLVRATGRRRDMMIRAVLGGGRKRLLRQLLVESLVIGVVAGGFGIALSVWVRDLLVAVAPTELPRISDVSLDARVLGFTMVITLGAVVGFGLLPALHAARVARGELTLRASDAGRVTDRYAGRIRHVLVVAQIAVAIVLMPGAGLLIRSFVRLRAVDPGLRADGVLTLDVVLPTPRYGDPADDKSFAALLVERARVLPGVTDVGSVVGLPFRDSENMSLAFLILGRPPAAPGELPSAKLGIVMPRYFETVGMAITRGRSIAEADRDDAAPVAVINQALADRYWPDQSPLGQRIELTADTDGALIGPREIVGVVGDVHQNGLAAPPVPEVYVPYQQFPVNFFTLALRTPGDPAALVAPVRALLADLDPELAAANPRTLSGLVAESTAATRFLTLLLTVFAGLALALSALGTYGMVAHGVRRRTRELGIRMAIGARPAEVAGGIFRQVAVLALVGSGVGVAVALGVTRLLASLLFGVSARDLVTFVAATAALVLVAAMAAAGPAWRATRVDPMEALRGE